MQWKSKEQRVREQKEINHAKGWHKVFTWLPVKLDNGKVVWLEKVALKYSWIVSCGENLKHYPLTKEYRSLKGNNDIWDLG